MVHHESVSQPVREAHFKYVIINIIYYIVSFRKWKVFGAWREERGGSSRLLPIGHECVVVSLLFKPITTLYHASM